MSYSGLNNKLLVIEDDLYMQMVLKEYLGFAFEVVVCADGLSALAFIQAGNIPDAIITDLNIPQFSGLDLVEQLRASDFFSAIPIIILTGEASTAKRIECLKKGADDFISKPFNPEELETRLNLILRRASKLNVAA